MQKEADEFPGAAANLLSDLRHELSDGEAPADGEPVSDITCGAGAADDEPTALNAWEDDIVALFADPSTPAQRRVVPEGGDVRYHYIVGDTRVLRFSARLYVHRLAAAGSDGTGAAARSQAVVRSTYHFQGFIGQCGVPTLIVRTLDTGLR